MIEKSLLILYGSQTGTAQDISERVWRETKFFGFQPRLHSMDDYSIEKLIYEKLIIFICATTGQGEEPDNMKNFWKFLLRKSLPSNSLQNVLFAVLGLGDSSYVKFNFVAKRLTRRLINLGGQPVVETGLADEQHDLGLDAVIDPWLQKLWLTLSPLYNFSAEPVKLSPESRWRIETAVGKHQTDFKDRQNLYSQRNPCRFKIVENVRTTAKDHIQDVRLIKFLSPSDLTYQPGDVLMLAPQNVERDVREFFEILNRNRFANRQIDPKTMIRVYKKDDGLPVPDDLTEAISLEDCAKKFWNLNAVPRRRVFSLLAFVTKSDLEKEKLLEFSDATGQEDLYNYCNRPKRTILEVLSDFPSASENLSLDFLFDVMEPIRPRAFSIASSPKMHENHLHILLAIVQYKTKLLAPRKGLCSTFLAESQPGTSVLGWIRSGSFRFPQPGTPVIMVGPGTGIAPFRSYIQELAANKQLSKGKVMLFFGCRNRKADFHFEEEWTKLQESDEISFFAAFSRDQPDKRYVQHIIIENSLQVWHLLSKENCFIFVAGNSKNMPQSVRDSFVKVAMKEGGLTVEKAEHFIALMERTNRYQTETWS